MSYVETLLIKTLLIVGIFRRLTYHQFEYVTAKTDNLGDKKGGMATSLYVLNLLLAPTHTHWAVWHVIELLQPFIFCISMNR